MFPFLSYITFLFSSTNQHGVHSPFIFQYLTRCQYRKPARHKNKAMDVVLKSIPYFKVKTIFLPAKESSVRSLLDEAYPWLRYGPPPYDLVYVPGPDLDMIMETALAEPMVHNNSLCILDRIHENKKAREQWERVKSMAHVRVTIDGFFCGLAFFRKEQARQHFKIRI